MIRYLASRIFQGLLVLFALYTITFFLVKAMPGDPFTGEKNIPEDVKRNMREQSGLNDPLFIQYLNYPKAVLLEGSFNYSIKKKRPVVDIIAQAFPASLALGVSALIFAVMLAIPIGVISAFRRNSWVDYSGMAIAMIGICVPSFVIGPLLQISIATHIPALRIAGWDSPIDILLPAITLGLGTAAYLARLTRGGMLEILSQDYIRTARAKGLSTSRIMIVHALRGGLIPSVAFIGPAFAALISGSFIVESIFQIPGMGQHFVTAITDRDEFLVLGLALFYGFLVVVMNLVADLLVGFLNPRVRLAELDA
ncbi:MAG: ABC transporter permease [Verrucomicrobiae bacterium]|nr:ABC transporter permease [Verrucomicrobiae bacterium]